MGKRATATILMLTLAALATPRAKADLPDRVDSAIAKAQSFLLTRPSFLADGNWEAVPSAGQQNQIGGATALVTYALLASGMSPNDPRLKRPIDYLRKSDMVGVYALGLRSQIWQYLPRNAENMAFVARDLRLLMQSMERDGKKPDGGLFDYTPIDRVRIDLSVSQYGTLGLWSCAQLGAEVPDSTWKLIDSRWKSLQDKATGGWSYSGGGSPTMPMTAAGIATLFITLDYLASAPVDDGNASDAAIDRGIAHLATELPSLVGAGGSANFYALYGVERIGVAGGYKLLGGIDWYGAGADFLCRTISSEGSWSGEWGAEVDTSFALLFLARGREPVMMNKIKYDQLVGTSPQLVEGRWNQRGRDVANAARYVGRQIERSFNWQIIDLRAGSVRDLHDAPIAYLSFRCPIVPEPPPPLPPPETGTTRRGVNSAGWVWLPSTRPVEYVGGGLVPTLPPESLEKLREYVESGGLLLVNGDVPTSSRGREQVASAATQATTRPERLPAPPKIKKFFLGLFPDATFRLLPPDHPILKGQQFKAANWQYPPIAYEVSNGVRTLAIYLADDPGRAWQLGESTKQREKFELIADIYQYAIDKEHAQVKGRTYYVEPVAAATTLGNVRVARIRYRGNCDPEPGGWRRVARLAQQEGINVQVETVDIEAADIANARIAHLTGVGKIQLSPAAVRRLKAFVDGGGTLLVDAAGGDATFAADVERALASTADAFTPGGKVIASDDPIYADPRRGPMTFRYRTFALPSVNATSKPRIRGTKVGGRWGYLYSTEDLSAGLVGQPVDGIRGYAPQTATEIVMRLIRANAK